ncbi:F-box/LRR-repeat protein 20 [Anabrus simplex]|uniref:F-box/LRR-repeat protein 20 n=1 Tax=Anabrus simplex TaxID=316456 RepID=UPI0034DD0231
MLKKKGIDDMPIEILLKILSYLDVNFLLYTDTVQNVCTRWRQASLHLQLWKHLVYQPEETVSDVKIISVLKKVPMLRTLIFDKVKIGQDVLDSLIEYCTDIRKLDLSKNEISSVFLSNLLYKCPKIEYLVIQNRCLANVNNARIIGQFSCLKTLIVKDESTSIIHLGPIAEGCPALQHLDIQHLSFYTSDLEKLLLAKYAQLQTLSLSYVSEERCIDLSECRALHKLSVDCTYLITTEPELQFLTPASHLTSLSLIDLRCIDVNSVKRLFEKKNMASLTELTIDEYYSYEDELANVVAFNCPLLKKLHLTSCSNLTDNSLKNLGNLSKLESVDFFDSRVTDRGIEYLTNCKHLKYLGLGCCRELRESGMKLMTNFTELEELVLYGCDISGLRFDLIPEKLKHLNSLQVSSESEYQDAEEQLSFAMPHLVIEHPSSLLAHLYQIFRKYQ